MTFKIMRDEAIVKKIEAACEEFWHCVETRAPPPPMNIEDAHKMWPEHVAGKAIEADPSLLASVGEYRTLKAQAQAMAKLAMNWKRL